MNRLALALLLVSSAACDGRYAHARCVSQPDEGSCARCCEEEGFSDEVKWDPDDRFVEPDCYCIQ